MLRIAICDDERKARDQLHGALEHFAREQGCEIEVLEFASADALLQNYPAGVDLLLLDIYMGGVDGMAAAAQIRTFDAEVCIVFITTMYQRAIEGYAVRAFGFIKKPVSYPELRHELECAVRQIQRGKAQGACLIVRAGAAAHRIPVQTIVYCEVRNHTVLVRAEGKVSSYRGQMKELEEQLLPHGFFRCHASYLVNGQHIRTIEQTEVVLDDGTVIPMSQRRRKEFLQELSKYIGEQI